MAPLSQPERVNRQPRKVTEQPGETEAEGWQRQNKGKDPGAGDVSLKYITKAKTEAKQEEIARAKRAAANKMGLQNGRYPDGIDKDIEKEVSGTLSHGLTWMKLPPNRE